mmetsp:Transcript_39671/g.112270  ORF Transcript_39671/g.112270 Transcript_39671/m.112270 type:complete len:205 (+) Transcript_39671:286-900(+)
MPFPMPFSRPWMMSAFSFSSSRRSRKRPALRHCFCAKQISCTRSWPFAKPLSFWRPVTNSSGETLPLLSASMISKRLSASSDMTPRSRSLYLIVSLAIIFLNSSTSSSPLPSRSASQNSSAIELSSSCSVFSRTLPVSSLLSAAMVCMRSTITAMMMFMTPKVQRIMQVISSTTPSELTWLRGLMTSVAHESSVMTCSTVHIDL